MIRDNNAGRSAGVIIIIIIMAGSLFARPSARS
jgi:hypothetical protein